MSFRNLMEPHYWKEQPLLDSLPYVSRHDKKLLKEIAQQINDEREESGSEEDWLTDSEGSDYEGSEDESIIP